MSLPLGAWAATGLAAKTATTSAVTTKLRRDPTFMPSPPDGSCPLREITGQSILTRDSPLRTSFDPVRMRTWSGQRKTLGRTFAWRGSAGRPTPRSSRSAQRVDPSDSRPDRDRLAGNARQAANDAGARRLDLHHRLSGLHLEQHIALRYAVALGNLPRGDHAGFHVHVDLRQNDFDRRHQAFPPRTRRRAAAAMSSSCGTAAFSSFGL